MKMLFKMSHWKMKIENMCHTLRHTLNARKISWDWIESICRSSQDNISHE